MGISKSSMIFCRHLVFDFPMLYTNEKRTQQMEAGHSSIAEPVPWHRNSRLWVMWYYLQAVYKLRDLNLG